MEKDIEEALLEKQDDSWVHSDEYAAAVRKWVYYKVDPKLYRVAKWAKANPQQGEALKRSVWIKETVAALLFLLLICCGVAISSLAQRK